MPRLATAVAVVLGSVAVVAPVAAQDSPLTDFGMEVRVAPKKAGTERSPRGASLSGQARWATISGYDAPIITGAEILLGKGFVHNGRRYPQCSFEVLDDQGPRGCPKRSIMGTATGPSRPEITAKPDIVVVNGGARRMFLYTTLYFPTLVQEPVPVTIEKLSGRWAYRLRTTMPPNLHVVAGVPIQLPGLNFKVGGKTYAKKYLATTACPKGGWRYRVSSSYLYYLTGQTAGDTYSGRMTCRK